MTLLIDAAATATKPSAPELTAWASQQRVFISSVMAELVSARQAIADAVEQFGAEPVWFEAFGGRDDDPQGAYLAEVASSTIYVGILARTYGRLQPSRLSATHEEYREAERRGLRISVWVNAAEDFQGDQATFAAEVRQFHTTGRYTDDRDLADGVIDRLTRIAADDLSPWCKVGDTAFRASAITDDGHTLTVRAHIGDASVLAALEGLRPGTWAGKRETRITYAGRSYAVRVASVTTTVTSARATDVQLVLERAPSNEATGVLPFSVNLGKDTFSADDITELSLRSALFGDKLPRGLLTFGGDNSNPLAQLPANALPVDLYRAVAGLLITEALVGSGRASRVVRVQLSPPGPAGRRLVVEWAGRTDRNTPAQLRVVDGYLTT